MSSSEEPTVNRLPPCNVISEDAAGVVVVGTGAAGASAALEASARGADVLVVTKDGFGSGSTPWAQGGMAAALAPGDSAGLHLRDTVVAGAGLCDNAAVEALVGSAAREIERLAALGAHWETDPLGMEGGHSVPRIVHAGGDATGAEVHRVLAATTARAVAGGQMRLAEGAAATDLVLDAGGAVAGLLVARDPPDGGPLEVTLLHTRAVVLATGGFGHAYESTTNPEGATGDGLALAARAGAELADIEFVQFHPTVLWEPGARGRRPLVTEALRGAGARLVDAGGRAVMDGIHPLADLAPRDVVAAAMAARLAATGDDHLWLDARALGARRLAREFPTVTAACQAAGIDPATDPIPVAPGAHYACGGVRADHDGATSVLGLWAVGEVASTGLHGANRLASNSLTEALTTGRRTGSRLAGARPPGRAARGLSLPPAGLGVDPGARHRLTRAMSRHAGVLRDADGLVLLQHQLASVAPASAPLDRDVLEATNLHTVSTLVVTAATTRTESRGCHRRLDHPETRPAWKQRIVLRHDGGALRVLAGELV